MNTTLDPALLAEFLQESRESLDQLEPSLVRFEREPGNIEILHSIFRVMHSLKGNAAFFQLDSMKLLAHELESLLGDVRENRREATPDVVSLILEGGDALRKMIDNVEAGKPAVADHQQFEDLVERIALCRQGESAKVRERAIVQAALALVRELQNASTAVPDSIMDHANRLARLAEAEKEQSGAKGPPASALRSNPNFNHRIGDIEVSPEYGALSDILSHPIATELAPHLIERVKMAIDGLLGRLSGEPKAIVVEMLSNYDTFMSSPIGFDEMLRRLLLDLVEKLRVHVQTYTKAGVPVPNPADAAEPATSAVAGTATIRIAESQVDEFAQLVEELSRNAGAVREAELAAKKAGLPVDTAEALSVASVGLTRIAARMRKRIATLRLVPAERLTRRVPRLVRDLALSIGRRARAEVFGEDVLLEKSILARLEDPLTHLLRNAVDHGIEPPDLRVERGKAPEGVVRVSLERADHMITLVVADDGAGIDVERVKEKALEHGHVDETRLRQMTDREAAALIFGFGVSTAANVSEVSGRGVGLDVVRDNVAAIHGQVTVESTPGAGTTFRLTFPAAGEP
ncbi:Hpt domain-containing protein [bacterium]|nr:Hpt domain-containing protein [bacterium]